MPLTPDQLVSVRAAVGSTEPPTDADLDALFDALGNTAAVAHAVLSERLATMMAAPLKVEYEGDVTEDWSGNVKALEARVAALGTQLGETGTTTGYMVRKGRRR